jgi:hypothetical protein
MVSAQKGQDLVSAFIWIVPCIPPDGIFTEIWMMSLRPSKITLACLL